MNPENPTNPRQALEPSLTALLLGELPEDQARFLRQAIATDPELAKTFERIKQTTELIRATETPPATEPKSEPVPLRLSDTRREQLLQRFKTVEPERFKQDARNSFAWLIPAAAAVAVVLVLAAALLPAVSRTKSQSFARRETLETESLFQRKEPAKNQQRLQALKSEIRPRPRASQEVALSRSTDANSVALNPPGTRGDSAINEPSVAFGVNGQTANYYATPPENAAAGSLVVQSPPAPGQSVYLPSGGSVQLLTRSGSETAATTSRGLETQPQSSDLSLASGGRQVGFDTFSSGGGGLGGAAMGPASQPTPVLGDTPVLGREFLRRSTKVEDLPKLAKETVPTQEFALTQDGAANRSPQEQSPGLQSYSATPRGFYAESAPQVSPPPEGAAQAADSKKQPARDDRYKAGASTAGRGPAEPELGDKTDLGLPAKIADLELGQKVQPIDQRELKEKAKDESRSAGGIVALSEGKQLEKGKPGIHRERLAELDDLVAGKPAATPPPVPPSEVQTHDNAFSTFSLNVSDVSFRLAGASLEAGKLPEPGGIRSEEFINAFDYRDPEPAPGQPVAFAWERALDPFAQNRDLLRFSLKTAAAGRPAGKPLNLVLVLDKSGSMERADRVRIIHEALQVLAKQLQAGDKLSVVTFARTARLWVDGIAGDQAGRVADELNALTPEGGTNIEEAMELAYQAALRHYQANGINRVVLLTDGAANLGETSPETLQKKVEANRKQGIALDCFGIGWEGYNDDLLEVLTRHGDGRYGFLNTPEQASTDFASQLAGALHVAASDVKVQVEFNPKRVTSYRQVGYAHHQLTREQFRDNSVDAAEIGAAECGNALYVIETTPQGSGPIAVVRVRYKLPNTTDYQEHEWTVPYDGNGSPLEQASPAMRLAATAAAFSEWLAASPYASEVNPDRLLGYLNGVASVYGANPRPQRLEWMIRQAKALAGK